jgi:alkanesulfonate monooxygenase SsuD/methylene tetrahydromethanopterin reductase-like flavin-dependent oxidoreductase (luciferase family)
MFFDSVIHGDNTSWGAMREVAQVMDAGRWHGAWTVDHLIPSLDFMDSAQPCLESWVTLAGLGAVTSRLRLGTNVSATSFRNPGLLAKMAATLDAMTSGRAILGIGASWNAREHHAYGFDFPSPRERSDRLEEASALIHALLHARGPVSFDGVHYRLRDAPFAPQHGGSLPIPIMIGGSGERRTLRTVARYGDIMNVFGTPEVFEHKVRVLEGHCLAEGRDPVEIVKTVTLTVALLEDEQKAERLRARFDASQPGSRLAGDDPSRVLSSTDLAIGSASHIVDVLGRYEKAGVDGVIFVNIPTRPELFEQLNDQILAKFDTEGDTSCR